MSVTSEAAARGHRRVRRSRARASVARPGQPVSACSSIAGSRSTMPGRRCRISAALGVTDFYSSPFLTAGRGSTHGYDIADHGTLNEELGGESGYNALSDALAQAGMGFVLDVVPNHMGVEPERNHWWRDVLENGPELDPRALLRHRLDAAQAGADRQGIASDPRRSVRRGARTRRAAARLPRRRAGCCTTSIACCRSIRGAASCCSNTTSNACARQLGDEDSRSARVPQHHHVAAEPSAGDRARSRQDDRASSRKGSRARTADAPRRVVGRRARAHRARDCGVERHAGRSGAASIGCTRCSTNRTIGWPTGGRRRTKSTTGASST